MNGNTDSWSGLSSAFSRRQLLGVLVRRNLKLKYQRSYIGFLWSVLNPLLTAGILILVFSTIVRLPILDYWAFLISGYFLWNFVQSALNASTYVMAEHGHLVRSVAIPLEILVLGASISRLLEFLAELALVAVAVAMFHHGSIPVSYSLLPVIVLLQLAMVLGFQLPLAVLSVYFRDLEHALPVFLTAVLYVSPVFYPAALVPETLLPYYMINPFAQLLTMYQDVLYEGSSPPADLLILTSCTSLLVLIAGYHAFSRFKRQIPEIV